MQSPIELAKILTHSGFSLFQKLTLKNSIQPLLRFVPKTMQGFLEHVLNGVADSKSEGVQETEKIFMAENFVTLFKERKDLFELINSSVKSEYFLQRIAEICNRTTDSSSRRKAASLLFIEIENFIKSLGDAPLLRYLGLASFIELVEGLNTIHEGVPFGSSDPCANSLYCYPFYIVNQFKEVLGEYFINIILSVSGGGSMTPQELMQCFTVYAVGTIFNPYLNSSITNTAHTFVVGFYQGLNATVKADIPDAAISATNTQLQNLFSQCTTQPDSNTVILGAIFGGVAFLAIVAAVCFYKCVHISSPNQQTETTDTAAEDQNNELTAPTNS
jgi:hypothetical protein